MDDGEQMEFVKSALTTDLRGVEGTAVQLLIRNGGSFAVRLIEQRVQEVLNSAEPAKVVVGPEVDPLAFVFRAAELIAEADDKAALQVFGRLAKVNPKRFGQAVDFCLTKELATERNPFQLAYWGLDLADPVLRDGIIPWAEGFLKNSPREYPGGPPSLRRRWAAAVAERYSGPPSADRWRKDPLASRLSRDLATSLFDEVSRLAKEEWEKTPAHISSLPQADLVALAKSRVDLMRQRVTNGEPFDRFDVLFALARYRSSSVMPIVEAAVRQAVSGSSVGITDSSRRQTFLTGCSFVMSAAADHESLKAATNLADIAEFSGTIDDILTVAMQRGNPFPLVYRALELNQPAVQREVVTWAERVLRPMSQNIPRDARRYWAALLVERYSGAPSLQQWQSDPLASRLNRDLLASARDQLQWLAIQASSRRTRPR